MTDQKKKFPEITKALGVQDTALTMIYEDAVPKTAPIVAAVAGFKEVADLTADVGLSYTNVAAGDVILAGYNRYEVVAAATASPDITTAGGVKLNMLAGRFATIAEYRSKTENVALSPDIVFDAAAQVTVTYASSVALDMSTGLNFKITLTGDLELTSPSNVVAGQRGAIDIIQDGTGGWTTSFNNGGAVQFKFIQGVTPAPTTTAGTTNSLEYYVVTSTEIRISTGEDWS